MGAVRSAEKAIRFGFHVAEVRASDGLITLNKPLTEKKVVDMQSLYSCNLIRVELDSFERNILKDINIFTERRYGHEDIRN